MLLDVVDDFLAMPWILQVPGLSAHAALHQLTKPQPLSFSQVCCFWWWQPFRQLKGNFSALSPSTRDLPSEGACNFHKHYPTPSASVTYRKLPLRHYESGQ